MPGEAAYIPLTHRAGGGDLFGSADLPGQMPMDEALAALRPCWRTRRSSRSART
jgi:DNA polymerase I